jgi:peptidyl-prolyl cis-trans isomerase C
MLKPLVIALAAAFTIATPALAQSAKPVATVNGTAIPQARAEAFINEQKAQGAPDNEELRKAVREELIRREIISQAAKKAGLDKNIQVAAQMQLSAQAILIRAYIQDYLKKNPLTDEMLKAEYDKLKAQMQGNEYKSRHVLVEKEEEAKAIIEKLGKGEKFADLAKASKDPGSKEQGGDLGWSAPGAFVKPFSDALTALQKGKYTTTPVKTEFGYHVILLEDTRPLTPPAFDQVKPQLTQHVQQQRIEKLVGEMREKAKID